MNISGNGRWHKACFFWFILDIIIGIFIIIISNNLANHYGITTVSFMGYSSSSQNNMYDYFSILGFICGIACFIYAILFPIAISKTRITIYNNKIEGVGVSKWFLWGDARTFNFIYSINQVSIELNGGKLIVNGGQNSYYSVYVKNGIEIQKALWDAKNEINIPNKETKNVNNTISSSKDNENIIYNKNNKISDKVNRDDNYWICGKCNEHNNIELDNCKKCGKEFWPS